MRLNKKILVADDESSIREVCRRVITDLGFDVDVAADGQAALDMVVAENGAYEMVLSDVMMPNLDGKQLIRAIRNLYPGIDCILMTGFPDIDSAVATLKAGAYDYLIKPVDIDLLSACVGRCWEKRNLADALGAEKALNLELEAACQEFARVETVAAALGRVERDMRGPLREVLAGLETLAQEGQAGSSDLVGSMKEAAGKLQARLDEILAEHGGR